MCIQANLLVCSCIAIWQMLCVQMGIQIQTTMFKSCPKFKSFVFWREVSIFVIHQAYVLYIMYCKFHVFFGLLSVFKTVKVSGIPRNMNPNILMLLFENRRWSGGGTTENVVFEPGSDTALITFADAKGTLNHINRFCYRFAALYRLL